MNQLRKSLVVLVLAGSYSVVLGLKCNICDHSSGPQMWNICENQMDMGKQMECQQGITTCYKSQTISDTPKFVRRCGAKDDVVGEKSCEEFHNGEVKAKSCLCDSDLCNSAKNIVFSKILLLFLPMLVAGAWIITTAQGRILLQ